MDNPADHATRVIRHTRPGVVQAALVVLDECGLPDLTMRRLASVLKVQASALYWHFPNKQALLAAVSDQILARMPEPASTSDWRTDLRSEARMLRDALLAFRDGAEVVSSTLALGLGGDRAIERLATAIRRGGFAGGVDLAAATAVLHFVLGHVSREQQHLQASSLGVAGNEHGPIETVYDDVDGFEFGITLLTGGLSQLDGSSLTVHSKAR